MIVQGLFMYWLVNLQIGSFSTFGGRRDLFLSLVVSVLVLSTLYALVYVFVYRKLRAVKLRHAFLASIVLGVPAVCVLSLAPAGLGLFFIAFLISQSEKSEYIKKYGPTPRYVELTRPSEQMIKSPFDVHRKHRDNARRTQLIVFPVSAVMASFLIYYMFFSGSSKVDLEPYYRIIFGLFLLLVFTISISSWITRVPQREFLPYLIGKAGVVSEVVNQEKGKYLIVVDGVKISAFCESPIIRGDEVKIKKITVKLHGIKTSRILVSQFDSKTV